MSPVCSSNAPLVLPVVVELVVVVKEMVIVVVIVLVVQWKGWY